jgi:class 3 adenylate cyclase/tetratricopeptide (TPR) repeat protein
VQVHPRRTAAILFTDLVESTALASSLGDAAYDELRRAHFAALRRAIDEAGGEEVKSLGDGVLAIFGSAADGLDCAVAIQQATDLQARTGAPVAVRVGLSLGDVSFEDADVYGTPVVEAARLVSVARGGQILATAVVQAVAGGRCTAPFIDLGLLELKGLAEPVATCEVAWKPVPTPSLPLPAFLNDPERVFVGRDPEIERLERCWRAAAAGTLRGALIAGEPGVGKTRLAAEIAACVHTAGATVLGGRCDEDLGVPYQPFVQALCHAVDHTAGENLPRRLGRYGSELARLVPELGELVPGLARPLQSDPETERYRLFDAVAAWLAATSAEDPVLLILDDLQWAAKPTLLLLRHVLRSSEPMRLLVLATYRDTEVGRGHPLSEFLADLRRLDNVERISLSGLDEPSVADLLERRAGHELGDAKGELAGAIHRETEGNAFFVREVVRHLVETGKIRQEEGRWRLGLPVEKLGIPEGVRDVMGRRLSRLSPTANDALALAAVAGQEFELTVVERAGKLHEEALLEALDEAVTARLVAEVPGSAARYRFAHALVRATLYEELTGARRAVLHRRIGEAIEGLHAGHLDDHLPALAHHFRRASAPQVDMVKAVTYTVGAGDRALAQLAHDEAAAYYCQALEMLEVAGEPHEDQRIDLLISLGEAQRRAGQPAHRETLLAAAGLAQRRGDADALARAALANNRGFFSVTFRVDAERVATLEAALEATSRADSPTRSRLLANLAAELAFDPDHLRRQRLAGEAIAMAHRVDDAVTLGHVLALCYPVVESAPAERRAFVGELAVVAVRSGDPALSFWAALWGAVAALWDADAAAFDHGVSEAGRLAAELNQPCLRWLVTFLRANQQRIAGHLEEAQASTHEAFRIGQEAGIPESFAVQRAGLFAIRYDQGRLQTLIDRLDTAVAGEHASPWTSLGYAVALCELGRRDTAQAVFDEVAAGGLPASSSTFDQLYGLTLAAEACAGVGDADRAGVLVDRLVPHQQIVAHVTAATRGAVSHYLGLLATTLRRFDEADAHFAAAEATHRRMGAPTLLARTRLEWARMLLDRSVGDDADRATTLLGQALTTARQLGLDSIERRAAALLTGSAMP